MSVYDLATDIGLTKGTDEYDTFVSCVKNILELGTGYNKEPTNDIIDKCRTSELKIAKDVVDACQRKPRTSKPPMRETRRKWWENYLPRRERISRDIYIDRKPSTSNAKRPMSPMFRQNDHRQRKVKRSRSPTASTHDQHRRNAHGRTGKRPMSPMFVSEPRRYRSPSPNYERHSHGERQRTQNVPQWGGSRSNYADERNQFHQNTRSHSSAQNRGGTRNHYQNRQGSREQGGRKKRRRY